jgi:glycerol-3-phosphate dehydrogenase
MKRFDAAVIGGGVLGCFAARSLTKYRLSVVLIESAEDVCTGITRANTAVVYAGYDHHPGSLKAQMTVQASASFDRLCGALDVAFSRCGSLMTACGPRGEAVLNKKLEQGRRNGVPGLRLLSGAGARELEPMLSASVRAALYAPTTGTVNPWQLGIAAWENARANGCETLLGARVVSVDRDGDGYRIGTERGEIAARAVINCAGTAAVQVQELLFPSPVRLRLDGADFAVFDPLIPRPAHILFEESETGKGITAVPCTEGNLLLDSPPRPYRPDNATTREGLATIREHAAQLLPALDFRGVIRSFGGVRPNPEGTDGRDIRDFCIQRPAPGFWSLIGVKTPGLTCADALGNLLARECAAQLGAERNGDFNPERKAIRPAPGSPVVCQCGKVSRDAVRQAIERGAVTADGVKRRVGSGMGRCQGSRCAYEIDRILKEYGYGGTV